MATELSERPAPAGYAADTTDFAGRVFLVTGGGSGLGRATALRLAALGAHVVLVGRTLDSLERTYDDIVAADGAQPALYPINLAGANWDELAEVGANLGEQMQRLDGVVHCAAHFRQFAAMQTVEPGEWQLSLQTQVVAPWALTRACLPLLTEAPGRGSVVFIGDRPQAFYGAYGVAKDALRSLVATWAADCPDAPDPRVNLYYPDAMRTPLRARGFPGENRDRLQPPEAAVEPLLWLLDPASAEVNGCAIVP